MGFLDTKISEKKDKINFFTDSPISLKKEDFFGIHSQFAEALYQVLRQADISKGAFNIGLYGDWGTGKTTVVNLLLEDIKEANKKQFECVPLYFDVWKFTKEPLKRAILFEMEEQLSGLAQGLSKSEKEFRNHFLEYKYQTSKGIFTLIECLEFEVAHDEEIKLRPEEIENLKEEINRVFRGLRESKYFRPSILFLIFLSLLAFKFPSIFDGLCVVFGTLVSVGIIGYILGILLPGFASILKKFVFKHTLRNLTAHLAFSGEQFGKIFKDMVKKARGENESRKILIVFDNLDRCEKNSVLETLSTIKTYLDFPGCLYIITCDDQALKKHLQTVYGENESQEFSKDFLDKLFQVTFRFPSLVEKDRDAFIGRCIGELGLQLNLESERQVRQILTLAYKGQTPRQIKRFLNDFGLYFIIAKAIESSSDKQTIENKLTHDMGFFSFMMVIKQIWPEFEKKLIEQTDLFHIWQRKMIEEREKLENLLDKEYKDSELYRFLNAILLRIELPKSLSPFIYLKAEAEEEKLYESVTESLWSGDPKYWQELDSENLGSALMKANDLLKGWITNQETIYIQNALKVLLGVDFQEDSIDKIYPLAETIVEGIESLSDGELLALLQGKSGCINMLLKWLQFLRKGVRNQVINRIIDLITYEGKK